MALITCPHCGKPVSDRAVKCPHCGCDPKEKGVAEKPNEEEPKEESHSTPIIEKEERSSNGGKIIIIILLVVIILAIIGFFGYQKFAHHATYDIPTDTTGVDSFDIDTTAVDTVATDDTQAKLEEFKNFRSNDLSAFMLHGKVKEMGINWDGFNRLDDDECDGDKRSDIIVKFNEQGELIEYVWNDYYNNTSFSYDIKHKGNELILHADTQTEKNYFSFELNEAGKLFKCNWVYYEYTSLKFNANGWPTRLRRGEADYVNVSYSDIDEFGNFRKMIHQYDTYGNPGKETFTREITYYPID